MNWNDLEVAWRRQEGTGSVETDVAALLHTFELKRRTLAATLVIRDFGEALAGLIVSGALAFVWWWEGEDGWPIALALGLVLGLTAFFLGERLRARRERLDADAPLLARVEAEIKELRRQRFLLMNVGWWYLAPIFLAEMIVVGTVSAGSPPQAVQREWWFLVGMAAFFLGVNWRVAVSNYRAVREKVDPRLEELEKMLRSVSEPN